MKKKVGFVCDISKKIGYGHFFRQLNFSDYFPDKFFDKRIFILNKKNSFKVFSNLKEKRVHFVNYFTNKNRQFSNLLIKEKIDILISDISHPENIRKKKFLTKYHLFLKKKNIFSISFDEPTQKLTSDLSIVPLPIDNINLSKNKKTNVLKGIKYIIFPKNFKKVKRKLISKVSKKIFIFISGTDEKKIFFKISKILIKINFPLILKIYTGPQKKLSFYKNCDRVYTINELYHLFSCNVIQ